MKRIILALIAFSMLISYDMLSKPKDKETNEIKPEKDQFASSVFNGLQLRLLGTALTSGRIIDIAVHPNDKSTWYVGVACGGVWKTTNAGINFTPIFDSQNSFSIGCISIDPNNPHTVWVGSGENNSQRSVSWGDGIYKSNDGGKSWKNMGLKKSEHIGKIIIDPKNSNIVYVAAQGPLWGPGGDRGLYKTTDGGTTWELVLNISENTGVTDVLIDPRNTDIIYAASYQRRRHVWTLINGGPEAAIHKSTDGGKTWNKLSNGLPGGDLGRIGLAISNINPDYIFATIEASDEDGGFYRSTNRGESWEKRSNTFSGSAQYYSEIVCDPKNIDRIYFLDTYFKVSDDGGKTFRSVGNKSRHVDDHAVWIDPNNTNYLLVGGDGGIYETYDKGENWRYFSNLPVTQFYRVTPDNSEPFYYVYGGTQDNNTWGAPSQTTNVLGISNEDWFLIVGGDGYKAQVDPKEPNIIYGQYQYGGLVRYDKKSGESVFIQPQPENGEEIRFNWDTPLLISHHDNKRIYHIANKLYRSDDRGQSWKAVSPDLTRKIDRNKLPVMGKIWSPEAIAKNASTSLFGNCVALSESPINQNLIYVGTDDGLIQITDDGGKNWNKIEKFADVPETTYVSKVYASLHNENVVYASFDNHKNNDFLPYIYKSNDKGKTWTSIKGNLPENGPVYTIVEDEVNPDLLFLGTEFGLYFTINGGEKWIQLKGSLPIIAIKDLEIQRREHDLVVGTFGRGVYILDNYTPLRKVNKETLDKDFYLFDIKDALFYHQTDTRAKSDQGEMLWRAKNPPYGVTFTYFMKEPIKTKKQLRKDQEAKDIKDGKTITYPSFDNLYLEDQEEKAYLIFTILDEKDNLIKKLTTNPSTGINRITWNMRFSDQSNATENSDPNKSNGMPVLPGKYKVYVSKNVNGEITKISDIKEFIIKPLTLQVLPGNLAELNEFQTKVAELHRIIIGTNNYLNEMQLNLQKVEKSSLLSAKVSETILSKIRTIEVEILNLQTKLNGNGSLKKRNENETPSIIDRLMFSYYGVFEISSSVTQTQRESFKIAEDNFKPVYTRIKQMSQVEMTEIINELNKAGAPFTPGRLPDYK
jgi:photosystem II stability/assembly factor-like uncharacterized protein